MGVADRDERIQLLESVLELPKPLLKYVRVPFDLSAGPLQSERLDAELISKGLIKAETPKGEGEEEEDEFVRGTNGRRYWPRRRGCCSTRRIRK